MEARTLTIDSLGPLPVLQPVDATELTQLVQQASVSRQPLYPVGGQTMQELGHSPRIPGKAVDLTRLDRVFDYPARDMTITVEAGITIAKLQAILAAEGQWLPIDVPFPERATLGGVIATNTSGMRRCGYGTMRDYLIGISLINDRGEVTKAGGRVVKNVAGYDLCKLYIGSLGTLGIVSQATLKVRPRPEASRLLLTPVAEPEIATVLEKLHVSRTRPAAVSLVNPATLTALRSQLSGLPAMRDGDSMLAVLFEDNAQAVAWQDGQLRQELPLHAPAMRSLDAADAAAVDAAFRDFPLLAGRPLTFKANLLPSNVPAFCRAAQALPVIPELLVHAANGIIIGHFPTLPERGEILAGWLSPLQAITEPGNGNLTITRCPVAWKPMLPIWGRPTLDRVLMRTIKTKLDPVGIFNPGRFVDGI